MIRRLLLALVLLFPFAAHADNNYKPDDMIAVSLSTEGWVTTKTARVVIQVNAAVSGDNAGATRDAMIKTVNQLVAVEWRLTSFDRSQNEAGLETWSAQFEARLPEADLNGLNEKTKKASKPGMQLSVAEIDFTPTLAENEAVRATLRKNIMDMANAELKAVQAAFPDRNYRIANIMFGGMGGGGIAVPMAPMAGARMMKSNMAAADVAPEAVSSGVQTAQRMQESAQVFFAALAPVSAPAVAGK